jgi:RNA polymerase sigma factor (TIGR02999 family)
MDDHPHSDPKTVTLLLQRMAEGRTEAADALLPMVYEQLRHIAQRRMAGERKDHTLQPTELVHEAYLSMSGNLGAMDLKNRVHFFAVAAEAMRRILVDYARRRGSAKRGGGWQPVALNVLDIAENRDPELILALDDAIRRLEEIDAEAGRIVRFRFFAGLSNEETAEALGISVRTVQRRWEFARAWLFKELRA